MLLLLLVGRAEGLVPTLVKPRAAPAGLPSAQADAEARLVTATPTGSAESDRHAISSLFRGCDSEVAPTTATVIAGALPEDLPRGALLRNGPNTVPGARGPGTPGVSGRGGWLDGDAMVHCVVLPPDEAGEPRFSRTHLRTAAFAKEEAAGRPLFDGSLVAPFGFPLLLGLLANGLRAAQPQKDTANTAFVKFAGGRLLALMEQCLPCEFRVSRSGALATVRAAQTLGGALQGGWSHPFSGGALTAHLKTDPATGEAIGLTYAANAAPWDTRPRFARHDVFGAAAGPTRWLLRVAPEATCRPSQPLDAQPPPV